MSIETLSRITAVITATEPKDMVCPECEGDGHIEYERTVGGVDDGGSPWQEYETYLASCDMCGGWGRVDIDPFDNE
jgi:hypothetical protein